MGETTSTGTAAYTAADRALRALMSADGAAMDVGDVAVWCGMTDDPRDRDARNLISVLISTNIRKGGGGWDSVKRVSTAKYAYVANGSNGHQVADIDAVAVYEDESANATGEWVEVGRDADTVVLRNPEGRMFVAKPLRAAM
ncbi:hypothetical protein [Nocardioides pakistanensis]